MIATIGAFSFTAGLRSAATKIAALAMAVLFTTIGCQPAPVDDVRHVSVLAEADGAKPDGTPWDIGGGDVIPVWGPIMLPSVFSTSPHPDLVLTVVSADGDARDYSSGTDRSGVINSDCGNRLACRWEIEVPATAYALVVTDVDPALNAHMTWDAIKVLLSDTGEAPAASDAPLVTSRQFVTGALFASAEGSGGDEFRQLELQVREWLASARCGLVPAVSLPRQRRDGCRAQKCLSDSEGLNGSLAISVMPAGTAPRP